MSMYQTVCERYGKKAADIPYAAIVGGGLLTGSPVFLLTSYVLYTASIVAENDIKSILRARRYGVTRGSKILRRTQFATAALSLCLGMGAQTIANKLYIPDVPASTMSNTQVGVAEKSAPIMTSSAALLLNAFQSRAMATTAPVKAGCIPCRDQLPGYNPAPESYELVPKPEFEHRVKRAVPSLRTKVVANTSYDAFAL